MSNCVSPAPEGLIDRFDWNEAGYYNTEQEAEAAIPPTSATPFEIFAYRIFPALFDEAGEQPFDPQREFKDLPLQIDLSTFQFIGYDIVERSTTRFFECSPLSCNGIASDAPVNTFCLLDDLAEAERLALEFGDDEKSGVEPSPYHIVEVWRKVAAV